MFLIELIKQMGFPLGHKSQNAYFIKSTFFKREGRMEREQEKTF